MRADSGTALAVFLACLFAAFGALIAAWVRGRNWGDLSSRMHYGEALSAEERREMKRSRRSFLIWTGISLLFAALSFLALR